jgi:tetratricopeptide (TPR) repeat protein
MIRETTAACLGLALLAAVTSGCQAPQALARQEATRRWNVARAQIKAKLAADRLAAGNVAGAAAELTEAERLDPENAAVAPLQARVWLAEGKTRAALDALEHTRLEGAAQAEVEYLKGVAWQQQQHWNEALAAFVRACELDEHEVAYVAAAAQTWLQLAQPDQALAFLTQHGQSFDWTDTYQASLAECYEQLGNWPAAAAAWQRVTSGADIAPEFRQRAAEALYRAGRHEDAIAVLSELVAGDSPETPTTLRLMLAECYFALGRNGAAREQIQKVLRHDANDAWALRLLARSLALEGELVAAQRVAQRALAADEQDPRTLELVAGLAWRTGDRALAGSAATRLAALDPANPVAQYVLAQAR